MKAGAREHHTLNEERLIESMPTATTAEQTRSNLFRGYLVAGKSEHSPAMAGYSAYEHSLALRGARAAEVQPAHMQRLHLESAPFIYRWS